MLTGLAQQSSNASDLPLLGGCLGAFALLIILVLIWTFIIAPRRARRQLEEYRERGYAEADVDAPELLVALAALTPIMPEGTLHFGEGRRSTLNAMVSKSGSHPRYVVNVAERTDDRDDSGMVWRTIFLEPRSLKVEAEFTARLTALNIGQRREERLGLHPVQAAGASPEFAAAYSLFSAGTGGPVHLSASLQEALLNAARVLGASSRFNTRFTPVGWAISVSHAYLQRKALRVLVDAAERISAAL
jgi:hypothetical protein